MDGTGAVIMCKYTQADFDTLVRDDVGYLYLPSGDWTEVDFGGANKLVFGSQSILGDCSVLGNGCKLGSQCKLGNHCWLGNHC